jgi:hypothetical protein
MGSAGKEKIVANARTAVIAHRWPTPTFSITSLARCYALRKNKKWSDAGILIVVI